MSLSSSIEWTDTTWNPLAGCSKVSPGCHNCYALRMAARLEKMGQSKYIGLTCKKTKQTEWSGKINFDRKTLNNPLEWKKPQFIFVNSMSDLFHENVSVEIVHEIWNVMARAHWHVFQILTKRPLRMHEFLTRYDFPVLPNVWLGVSVENANFVERIDVLKLTPANIRVVSFEPLLGSVGKIDLRSIDWAIVGGESGPRARPIKETWVDEIFEHCQISGTPFFFKQWGGTFKKKTGRTYKGQIWGEYPNHALTSSQITL